MGECTNCRRYMEKLREILHFKSCSKFLGTSPTLRGLEYAGEHGRCARQRGSGDGEMDDVVGVPVVPCQGDSSSGDRPCYRAVLLQQQQQGNKHKLVSSQLILKLIWNNKLKNNLEIEKPTQSWRPLASLRPYVIPE